MSSQPRSSGDTPPGSRRWKTVRLGSGQVVTLASLRSRLVARTIDVCVMVSLTALLWRFLLVSAGVNGFVVFYVVVGFIYEIILTASKGQTLGKMMLRTRVVQGSDGLVPSLGRSAQRWLLPGLLLLALLVSIVFLQLILGMALIALYGAVLRNDNRQGWHDKAARTVVIVA